MTQKTYDNIQGLLSYGIMIGGLIGFAFWADYNQLLSDNDVSPWGYAYAPIIYQSFFALFAVSLIAKLWGSWIHNRFWLKVEIADKLHAIADKLDPRRH